VAGTTPADYQTTTGTISATVTSTGALSTITATRAWLQANQQATSYSLSTPILPNYTASWAPAAPLGSAAVSMTSATLSGAPVAGTAIHTAQRLQTPP
jgi:hypothetical protein